jgi:hypothetical protein
MKLVSKTALSLFLTLSLGQHAAIAAENQSSQQVGAEESQSQAQDTEATPAESELAETRAIQAIHLSNLTQFAAQLIAVTKLPDSESKQLAWEHAKEYGQWEVDLVVLAQKSNIPLVSDEADIIAIKDKNQELLKQLTAAPKDEAFKDTFNQLIWAEQGALAEFLDKESKVGFADQAVADYVNEIVANLQKP